MSVVEYNASNTPNSLAGEGPTRAVLRSGESNLRPIVVLDWSGPQVQFAVQVKGTPLFAGNISQETRAATSLLTPSEPWLEVCRETNEHGEFIEIEQSLGQGFLLQRQVVLARDEDLLLLADAVLGPEPAPGSAPQELNHQLNLPFAKNIAFTPAEETHEGLLGRKKPLARVLPLAFPEWRRGFRGGELRAMSSSLQLAQQGLGNRLYAPLVFDLRPRRLAQPFTWRKLTVAENLAAVRDDQAVGYRVQLARQQWLVYRSLGPRGNRTVLGHNLCSEFLLARFTNRGETEACMEIE